MPNAEIRRMIENNNLLYWKIADKVGISSVTFSVWLRHELTSDKKNKVLTAIKSMI